MTPNQRDFINSNIERIDRNLNKFFERDLMQFMGGSGQNVLEVQSHVMFDKLDSLAYLRQNRSNYMDSGIINNEVASPAHILPESENEEG